MLCAACADDNGCAGTVNPCTSGPGSSLSTGACFDVAAPGIGYTCSCVTGATWMNGACQGGWAMFLEKTSVRHAHAWQMEARMVRVVSCRYSEHVQCTHAAQLDSERAWRARHLIRCLSYKLRTCTATQYVYHINVYDGHVQPQNMHHVQHLSIRPVLRYTTVAVPCPRPWAAVSELHANISTVRAACLATDVNECAINQCIGKPLTNGTCIDKAALLTGYSCGCITGATWDEVQCRGGCVVFAAEQLMKPGSCAV
jgi:hypothetical protein